MNNILRNFGLDKELHEAVQLSFVAYLDSSIIQRVYAGKDITGYKEANNIFDEWLRRLKDEVRPRKEIPNPAVSSAE